MAVLKYRNGYTIVPGHGSTSEASFQISCGSFGSPVIPTPFQLWPAEDQNWLQPLYILFSVVWGLELCVVSYKDSNDYADAWNQCNTLGRSNEIIPFCDSQN